MTRNQLIEQTFALQDASAGFLLLLRLILDIDKKNSNLQQDIHDLFEYPERLENSYSDEWRSWIKNVLHRRAFRDRCKSDSDNLKDYIENQYTHRAEEINSRYAEYVTVLEKIAAINAANNVSPIKSRFKQTLELLVS